jgi:hypothetical protein
MDDGGAVRRSAGLPVLDLAGTPRERGRAHGEALRGRIRELTARWQADIAADLGVAPETYIDLLVETNDFLAPARRWAPDLVEEVAGIAEGSGVDFKTTFARQLADEDFWFRLERKFGVSPGAPRLEQCSSVGAVNDDGSVLVAQNMDLPAYWDGYQALLRIRGADGLDGYVFTATGQLALCGMNSRGVGVCCNTILQCDHSHSGLPEAFVVRLVLAQPNLDAAVALIAQAPHASPQNYLLGGTGRVVDLEVSANKISRFIPTPDENRVYHTNHPLLNDDRGQWHAMLARMTPEQAATLRAGGTTYSRGATLEEWFRDAAGPITTDRIRAVLSSHQGGVCRHGGAEGIASVTFGCAIMELAPAPRLHLAPGPGCETEFRTYVL